MCWTSQPQAQAVGDDLTRWVSPGPGCILGEKEKITKTSVDFHLGLVHARGCLIWWGCCRPEGRTWKLQPLPSFPPQPVQTLCLWMSLIHSFPVRPLLPTLHLRVQPCLSFLFTSLGKSPKLTSPSSPVCFPVVSLCGAGGGKKPIPTAHPKLLNSEILAVANMVLHTLALWAVCLSFLYFFFK